MPDKELAELRRVVIMGEEERARHLRAIRVRGRRGKSVGCVCGGRGGWRKSV